MPAQGVRSPMLVVFGLGFAAFSLGFGWMFAGDDIRTGLRARSYVEVPGTLVEVSGHPRGMGARYHYEFGGRRHEATRVGFYDNWSGTGFDEMHRANYRSLRAKLEASGPVRSVDTGQRDRHALRAIGPGAQVSVWVDPARPAEAVLDPRIRWERLKMPLMIVGALAAGGLLFAAIGWFGGGSSPEAAAASVRAKRPLRGSSHRFPVLMWAMALAWNAFVAVMGADFRPVAGRELLAWGAAALFAAVGLYLLWSALVATLRWRRYRGIALALEPHPPEAGGAVAGSLVVPVRYSRDNRFRLALTCTEHGLHGGELRKNNSYQRALFEAGDFAAAKPAPGGTRLEFRIALPPEAPASNGYLEPVSWTGSSAHRIFVKWTLQVSAEVEGADLHETFEIPVRAASPQSVPVTAPLAAGVAPARAPRRPDGPPGYEYEREGRLIRVTQPAWRKPVDLLTPASLVFGLGPSAAFAAVGVFLFGEREWLLGGVFFAIGCLVLLAALGYLAHSLTVEIDDGGVRIVRRVFGLTVRERVLERLNIAAVESEAESSKQSGASMLLRNVKVRMLNGETWNIAEWMPHEQDAVALRNLVAARLAVRAGGSSAVAQPTPQPSPRARPALGGAAAIVGTIALIAYMAWPFLKPMLGFGDHAPTATRQAAATATRASAQEPALGADDWRRRFSRAHVATIENRPQDALRHYADALAVIERTRGPDDPLAAAMLERIGQLHTSSRNYGEAEPALRRAAAILAQHPHQAIRAEAGKLIFGFDRESVLRAQGWALWELRRYPESLEVYQHAYDTVAELPLDEASRNTRLAYNAAGIMAGACTQKQWERADRAMSELKERIQRVAPSDRRWLEYWIRTGEPRLAARQC